MTPTLCLNIQTVLHDLNSVIPYSDEAHMLLCGTCAQESAFGKYRRQIGGGPALGIFQMEPGTFDDIVINFMEYKPQLADCIMDLADVYDFDSKLLEVNDILSTCFARVHYFRVKEKIPSDLPGQAEYWKKHYNTYQGKGKVEDYIANYKRYVLSARG